MWSLPFQLYRRSCHFRYYINTFCSIFVSCSVVSWNLFDKENKMWPGNIGVGDNTERSFFKLLLLLTFFFINRFHLALCVSNPLELFVMLNWLLGTFLSNVSTVMGTQAVKRIESILYLMQCRCFENIIHACKVVNSPAQKTLIGQFWKSLSRCLSSSVHYFWLVRTMRFHQELSLPNISFLLLRWKMFNVIYLISSPCVCCWYISIFHIVVRVRMLHAQVTCC